MVIKTKVRRMSSVKKYKGAEILLTVRLACHPDTGLQRLAEEARTIDFITHSTASSKSISVFASVPLIPKSQGAT